MNLYWKIFVSFMLAMTITLVGAIVVSFELAEEAFQQSRSEGRVELIGPASQALAAGGVDGLRSWLRENRRPSVNTLLLIVDDAGIDLLGRPIPGRFRDRFLENRRRGGNFPPNYRPERIAPRLISGDGRDYYLLFTQPPPSLFGVLTLPSAQIAVVSIAVFVAAITALILARYISSPVVRIQRAARELTAGRFDSRVGQPFDRRHDEVGTLARDFDTMAEQIQNLLVAKETLLRDVSHELRSPLARIRMALALAERQVTAGADNSNLVRIEEETERLDRLVGQILELARLRAHAPIERHPIRLDKLLEEVAADASYENPNVTIRRRTLDPGLVNGDALQLHSAVENVVRNAMSYAGDDGEVSLEVARTGSTVQITVSDTGPGVAEADLTKIFEPFYRTDPSRDHQRRGEGIGLAITAGVIARHDGTCKARNRAEKNGAAGGLEVTLSLPAAPA